MSGFLRRASFSRAFVGRKSVVPEAIEIGAQSFNTGRVQLVEAAVALRPIDHQMRMLEDPQMLRDGGTAHRKAAGQFTHRLGTRE